MPLFNHRNKAGTGQGKVVKLPSNNLFDYDTPAHTTAPAASPAVKAEAAKMLAMTPEQRKAHLAANPRPDKSKPDERLAEMNRQTFF
jgi:hypothetical protein